VIAGSEVTRSFLQGLGVPEERIEVIRAPVQLDAFASASTAVPSRRTLHVLYLGSQADWQGIPVLLQALRIALDAKVALQLSLVGPFHPVHKPVLEALVEELELGEHVSFLPAVPHEELPGVLASADVFAVPLEDVERNRVVGGPLSKCADYLAAGRPIVASDLPLTRELLPPEASLFHPPGDSEALAAQLKALAGDLRQRLRMGFAARETARRFHDAKAARRHLKSLYAALENAADEILQADDAIESYEIIPPRLDPWFAQLVHGYCPPEGAPSPLPTAPTNFPGREGPPPATVQPSAGSNPSFPSRSGGG
jgi:glycosyltransferase involved in cell wall biosynthesis